MPFTFYFLSLVVFLNVSAKASNSPGKPAWGNSLTEAVSKNSNEMLAATNPIRIGNVHSNENPNPVITASSSPPSAYPQNQVYSSASGETPYNQQFSYNQPPPYYQQAYGQQPYIGSAPPSYQGMFDFLPRLLPTFDLPPFRLPSFSNYIPQNLERFMSNPFSNMQVDQTTQFDDGKFKAQATTYKTDPNDQNVKGSGISTSASYSNSMKTNPDGSVTEMTPQEIEELQRQIQSRMSSMWPPRIRF